MDMNMVMEVRLSGTAIGRVSVDLLAQVLKSHLKAFKVCMCVCWLPDMVAPQLTVVSTRHSRRNISTRNTDAPVRVALPHAACSPRL